MPGLIPAVLSVSIGVHLWFRSNGYGSELRTSTDNASVINQVANFRHWQEDGRVQERERR